MEQADSKTLKQGFSQVQSGVKVAPQGTSSNDPRDHPEKVLLEEESSASPSTLQTEELHLNTWVPAKRPSQQSVRHEDRSA
jgi:hypothetical protein